MLCGQMVTLFSLNVEQNPWKSAVMQIARLMIVCTANHCRNDPGSGRRLYFPALGAPESFNFAFIEL